MVDALASHAASPCRWVIARWFQNRVPIHELLSQLVRRQLLQPEQVQGTVAVDEDQVISVRCDIHESPYRMASTAVPRIHRRGAESASKVTQGGEMPRRLHLGRSRTLEPGRVQQA